MSKENNKSIDIVYLWVDGSDPKWIEKKNKMLKKMDLPAIETAGRFDNNDELKYSLRSVEKHASWVRNIFIVTDNQIPEWLDTSNSKIKIIDHKEILPEIALPCFNSSVIEYFIYKIEGLSEKFLYANDDMFFYKNTSPTFFFKDDDYPYVRFSFKLFNKIEDIFKSTLNYTISNYKHGVNNATKLIAKKKNRRYLGVSHHNIDGFLKSDFKRIVEIDYKDELSKTFENHFRTPNDIQRHLVSLDILLLKHGHLKYIGRKESLRIRVHRGNHIELIKKYNPTLFCLNDTEYATDADRTRIQPFLESLFPNKSSFEK